MEPKYKEKSKISIFLPSLRGGGAERVMVTLANEFAKRGYEVDLLLAKAEGPYLSEVSKSVHIIDFKVTRALKCIVPIVRYLKKNEPNVLLSTMSHANIVSVLAKIISRKKNVRVIIREANVMEDRKTSSFYKTAMRLVYPKACSIIAVSEAVKEDLVRKIGLTKEQIRVINNPVDFVEIEKKAQEPLSHGWSNNSEVPFLLAIGRLTKQKNYPLLIAAFDRVRRKMNCKLVILGDGEDRENLINLINAKGLIEDIAMPGFVENPFNYMKHAKVIVSSSSWEGLPNVLIQALALGKTIVATDCPGGSSEILEGGKYGILVASEDVEALAGGMEEALEKPSNYIECIKRASDFSVDKITDEYCEAFF